MKKTLIIILLATVFANATKAVTAYPELVKFLQPDKSTTLMLYLMGDEKVHWAETIDGYSLVTNDDGYFVYATKDAMGNMMPSNFVATDVENRNARTIRFLETTPKHLRYSKMQIDAMLSVWDVKNDLASKSAKSVGVKGDRKILVILMGFQDKRFMTLKAVVRSLFNEVNYTATGAYGSVHDYYYENSYGQLNLSADVVGPFLCDSNAAFYGRNDNQTIGYQSFAMEAVIAASSYVNFSDYDNDGDGVVDCVHILFAGYGEEAGGGADCIWSHKWSLFQPLTYNNTIIDKYSCSPEFGGNMGNNLTGIGVICHEIGHVFGAPDFYDTDYGQSGGQFPATGNWDIMASGSWNMGGGAPAHHNPYTKSEIYKWITIKNLNTPSCVNLLPASSDSSSYYKLSTTTPGEYYLIENRQRTGFDRGLPGHGMIVYHAHKDLLYGGGINITHPQKFYVVSAASNFLYPFDSVYPGINTQECPFPGSTYNQTLNDTTHPSLLSWAGANSGHRLSYIGENIYNNTVSFVYNDGCVPEADKFNGIGISGSKVQLHWETFGSQKVMIVVNDTDYFYTPQNRRYSVGDTLPAGERVVAYNLFDEYAICSNLNAQTKYYFRLYTMLNYSTYTQWLACTATTLCANSGYPYYENFQFSGTTNFSCWTFENEGQVLWKEEQEGYNRYLSLKADTGTAALSRVAKIQITPLNLENSTNLVLSLDVRNPLYYDTVDDSTIVPRIDTLVVKYRNASMHQWQILRILYNDMPVWQCVNIPLPNTSDDYLISLEGHYGGQTLSFDNLKIVNVHLISVTTDGNGTVSPGNEQNSVAVPHGGDVTFTITPDQGYVLGEIYVDYVLQRISNPFVLNNVVGSHVLYVTFNRTQDIADVEVEENMVVACPNPVTDKLRLILNGGHNNVEYGVFDVTGRMLDSGMLQKETPVEINVSNYSRGVYYVKITGETFKSTKKIIKQ